MSGKQKATENQVFNQELSLDDLDAVAGGNYETAMEFARAPFSLGVKDANTSDCSQL